MIHSGELMKYLLAIVAKLFERYGCDPGLSNNIMCAFFKTLLRSSLGRKTVGLCMHGIVPAFHGHAHNRMCQIGWHPMYECEHTFCLSNHLASCTRLSTPFHRQQQIDEHFHFHDLDKHAASGNFIFQNYHQAVKKITANRLQLSILEANLGTTAADYQKDLEDERAHLEPLLQEPPEVQWTVDYVELLQKLNAPSETSRISTLSSFVMDIHALKSLRSKRATRTTYNRLVLVEEEVCCFEEEHEYHDALILTNQHRYCHTLNNLERLVVQRLLELTKLSMSSVGASGVILSIQ
ncbi:hypothetical protein C8R45DRAFT_1057327 [Mycena sanguinolenta]|nr:hypothetical protein C8R45DRAFT_1057327 [Mycena sanguinolenta]